MTLFQVYQEKKCKWRRQQQACKTTKRYTLRLLIVLMAGAYCPAWFGHDLLKAQAPEETQEAVDWSGAWDTNWRGGKAHLVLIQDSMEVTGTYEPFGGRIEAVVDGNRLQGEWIQQKGRGGLIFTMSPDGGSFVGRYDSGEWWNGKRVLDTTIVGIREADLSSPQEAIKTFLTAFNQFREGILTVSGPALASVDFGPNAAQLSPREKFLHASLLFDVLDKFTIHIWEEARSSQGNRLTIALQQTGTDVTFDLTLRRRNGDWRLVPLTIEQLEAKLVELIAARGIREYDPDAYLQLPNPRATFRVLLEQSKRQNDAGRRHAITTLDLSEIDESVRDAEATALIEYLRLVLSRVSFVIYQEIPDDPNSRKSYIHFEHPRGEITIAPYSDEGRTTWKFTAATLRTIRDLYSSFEDMPVVEREAEVTAEEPLFFRFRQWLGGISPLLLDTLILLENWQWLGLLLIIALGAFVGLGLAILTNIIIRRKLASEHVPLEHTLEHRFVRPARIIFMAGIWYFGFQLLRLPEEILPVLKALSLALMVIGGVWAAFIAVTVVGDLLLSRANKTETYLDDVFTSLLSGVAKIAILIVGVLLFADALGLQYGTVLAGLGIGGLAFAIAAQDTIANFFGSAVILVDRPFRKGDIICMGDVEGEVENVGLRSSQIRTFEDSVIFVPNRLLANESIDNRGRRRARRIKTLLSVTYDTPPERLEAFVDALQEMLTGNEFVLKDRIHVGVWEYAASSIDIILVCYLTVETYAEEVDERHKLFVAMTQLAADMDIEYAFPTRTLYLNETKDGNESLTETVSGDSREPAHHLDTARRMEGSDDMQPDVDED